MKKQRRYSLLLDAFLAITVFAVIGSVLYLLSSKHYVIISTIILGVLAFRVVYSVNKKDNPYLNVDRPGVRRINRAYARRIHDREEAILKLDHGVEFTEAEIMELKIQTIIIL